MSRHDLEKLADRLLPMLSALPGRVSTFTFKTPQPPKIDEFRIGELNETNIKDWNGEMVFQLERR